MENKLCVQCGDSFVVDDDDIAFYKKMTVSAGEKKFQDPIANSLSDLPHSASLGIS